MLLGEAFDKLRTLCINSSIHHFEQVLDYFIIIYEIFVTVTLVSLAVFFLHMVKHIKKDIWNTNLLGKLVPRKVVLAEKESQKLKKLFAI